jgi:hypothetical protein
MRGRLALFYAVVIVSCSGQRSPEFYPYIVANVFPGPGAGPSVRVFPFAGDSVETRLALPVPAGFASFGPDGASLYVVPAMPSRKLAEIQGY